MYPATYSTDEQKNWKATMIEGSPWSRHLMMAVIFNLLNLFQLMWFARLNRGVHYWSAVLIVITALYVLLGYYAVLLYRGTRERLKSLPEEPQAAPLRLSYTGYRLYLTALFLGLIILGFFNLIRR